MHWRGLTAVEVVVVVVVAAILLAIAVPYIQKRMEFKAQVEAGTAVWNELLRAGTANRIYSVSGAPPGSPYYTSSFQFSAGHLERGMSIVFEGNDAAFWVKDGTIYAVNGAARDLLPKAPHAPSDITYEAVRRTAK